ncbi:MAG: phage tail protein [Pseudohongiella sp.]|nr:phage tail protein [Pseudohongiella sp.]
MEKLKALRKHLIERVPGLKKNPDRLLTFVEEGAVEFHRGANLSHEYTLPVRIVLTDYSGSLDLVMLPLLQWLSTFQPNIVPAEAVRLDAEILSNTAMDLSLQVTLTERVVAIVDCAAGKIQVDHRKPEFDITTCPATHWQIFIRDEEAEDDYTLIAEWGEDSAP